MDPAGTQSATVSSPNVTMMITDRSGNDITAAQVGDPLALRFEIIDENSWVYLKQLKNWNKMYHAPHKKREEY